MRLATGSPFWPIQDGLIRSYPPLRDRINAEVVVIGAGVTGAIIADRLSEAGHQVVVVDRRDVGAGSTSATTALLQWDLDCSVTELAELRSTAVAEAAYGYSRRALVALLDRAEQLGAGLGFARRHTLKLASSRWHVKPLRREYAALETLGFPVRWLSREALLAEAGLDAPAAIESALGGEVDPYALTHALLRAVVDRGGRVFDQSAVEALRTESSRVIVELEGGGRIDARSVVVAAGYETGAVLGLTLARLSSTFAFVTEPSLTPLPWTRPFLVWETARPYCYLRSTWDGRLLMGGLDEPFVSAAKRDRKLDAKVERLTRRLAQLWPALPAADVAYAWAGTFGETNDGLPCVDVVPNLPNVWCAGCYGGNGVVFGMLAALILADEINGRRHSAAPLVGLGRLTTASD